MGSGGIWQFIKFVLDRGSIETAKRDAATAGAAIGAAAGAGATKLLPHTSAAIREMLDKARPAFDRFRDHARTTFSTIVASAKAAASPFAAAWIRATDAIQNRLDQVREGLKEGFAQAMPVSLGILVADAVRGAVQALKDLSLSLIQAAADSQRLAVEFEAVFQQVGPKVEATARQLARQFGASKNEMRGHLIQLQGLAIGYGLTREAAADFTITLAKVAGDIAAFTGVPFARAMHAVRGALNGNTEMIHTLGIMVNEHSFSQAAMARTGQSNIHALTGQEQAMVKLESIMQKSSFMSGSAERNGRNLSVVWGQITAIFKDVRDEVATGLIPIFTSLSQWVIQNREAIEHVARFTLRSLGEAIAIVAVSFRILADVGIAATYGILGGLELLYSMLLRIGSYVPGLGSKLGAMADDFANRGFVHGAIANAAVVDAGTATTNVKGEKPHTLRTGDGPVIPGRPKKDKKGPREKTELELMDEEIDKAEKLVRWDDTRAAGLERLISIRNRLRIMERDAMNESNPDKQVEALERLRSIRETIAELDNAAIERAVQDLGLQDQHGAKLRYILKTKQEIDARRAEGTKSAEDMEALDALDRQIKMMLSDFSLPEEFAGIFESAVTGAETFGDALNLLRSDANLTHKVLMAIGSGTAQAMMKELSALAKGKVLENLAWAVEDTARGIFNPIAHPGAFAAAAGHLKAAAMWGTLAAVAGSAAGGGGGSAGGGSAPGREGGSTADQAKTLPAITNVYIDGMDPNSAVHQALVGDTLQQGWERGVVNIFPTSAAPPALRGTA